MKWPLELVKPAGFDNDTLLDGPTHLDPIDERILTLATTLRHQGLEQWQACAVNEDFATGSLPTGPGAYREGASYVGRVVCGLKLPSQGSPTRRMLAAFGRYGATGVPSVGVSGSGSHWFIGTSGPGGVGTLMDYANGDSGVLIASAIASRDVFRREVYDGAWTTSTAVVAAGHGVIALHWIASEERLIATDIGGTNNDKVLISDDAGVTWTRRSFGGLAWTPMVYSDDGAGNVACIAAAPSIPSTSPKLVVSHDNGETWAPILNTALPGDQNILNDSLAGTANVSVTYVPDQNALVVVAGPTIYRSIDGGISWERRGITDFSSLTSPFSIGPNSPDGPVPNHFAAAIGPCLACSVNWPVINNVGQTHAIHRRVGIVYSFDLGDTWKLVDVGPTFPIAKRATMLRAWNERFVLASPGVVYLSGLIASSPPVDFSADG